MNFDTLLVTLMLFIHIGAGIVWIGGLIYLRFILLPALGRMTPQVRGPLIADVGPRTVRFILRVAEVTIFAGFVNFFLLGGMARMPTQWGSTIGLGMVLALAIYIIGQAVTRPTTLKLAATVQAVLAGNPPADAPALIDQLAARQRQALNWQVGLGIAVVFTMAVARFS